MKRIIIGSVAIVSVSFMLGCIHRAWENHQNKLRRIQRENENAAKCPYYIEGRNGHVRCAP